MILQPTEVLQPETELKDNILIPVKHKAKKADLNFDYDTIKIDSYAPLVRAAGITDQEWNEIQHQSEQKISEIQTQVDNAAQASRIEKVVASNDLIVAAYSGNDAIASASHAANLLNVINNNENINSSMASEIASQVARAADAAQLAASQSNDEEIKKAASVANILSAEATASAIKIKESELKIIQSQTENTLLSLIDKAKASDTLQDKTAVTLAQQRLTDANKALSEIQTLSNDAAQYSAMIKSQAEADAAAVALALITPVEVITKPKVKKDIFGRLIDFIYDKIYA